MAGFAAAGLNCAAVGPRKLYIYNTDDTLRSTCTGVSYGILEYFNTANCPGMTAGDIILSVHATGTKLSLVEITGISAATCTFVEYAALS